MKIEVLENIKKLFPFITLWILLLSACKELIYYHGFGIAILHYMELSELTYLFLDDIIIWSFFLILFLWFSLAVEPGEKLSVRVHPFNPLYTYIFVFIASLTFVVADFLENYLDNGTLYIGAITILITSFLIYLLPKYKNSYLAKYGIIIPFSFLMVYFVAKFKTSIVEDNLDQETVITFEGKDIYSDTTSFYIGQTKRYLFFYDKEKEESTVYDKNKISKMKFSK